MSSNTSQPAAAFLLWSGRHQAWWRPCGEGYTTNPDEAGRFSEADAQRLATRSQAGPAELATTIHPDSGRGQTAAKPDQS